MALVLKPGDRLGAYKVLDSKGLGGTAETYKVDRSDGIGPRFAKVFLEPTAADARHFPERVNAFKFFQVEMQNRLNKAAFGCRTLDFFEFEQHFVKITELIDGVEVGEYLAKVTNEQQWDIALIFCYALRCAHEQGVANLDLKPENLLVTATMGGKGSTVRMIDFDAGWIDCDIAPGKKFRKAFYGATPGYYSPEHFEWHYENPKRHFPEFPADVFQAGLVLFEIFTKKKMATLLRGAEPARVVIDAMMRKQTTGVLPSVAQHKPSFPAPASELIQRMLNVNPKVRPKIMEVHDELRQLRTGGRAAAAVSGGLRLVVAGKDVGSVAAKSGASVMLGSSVVPAWSAPVARLFYDKGQFMIQAFKAQVLLDGKPVPPGTQAVPVKAGQRLAFGGVQVEVRAGS